MVFTCQKGIDASAIMSTPLLVIMYIILVARALMLPGALGGLDAFFRPNWEALLSPPVWVAAYGQIFFSLRSDEHTAEPQSRGQLVYPPLPQTSEDLSDAIATHTVQARSCAI